MKKCGLFFVLVLALVLSGCAQTYPSPDALVERVREEIPIAEADTAEIKYAGLSQNGDTALLWYISGSEQQARTYFPIECAVKGKSTYQFIRSFQIVMDRCEDVGIVQWEGRCAFCVNNPNCKAVRITDASGTYEKTVDTYPWVFHTKGLPSVYTFLDANGSEIK